MLKWTASTLFLQLLVSAVDAQTVYMAGDSTMAPGGGGSGTDGWGQYLGQYINLPVSNKAIAGRSARSYTDEGRFTTLYNTVKRGDFVIIEFGHNDGTANPDNGRQDAVGDGYDTVATVTPASGPPIVVHTFDYYIQNAITNLTSRGAIPLVSSQTPDNIWPMTTTGNRFVTYAQEAGQRTGVPYINHFAYTAQAYIKLGQAATTAFYPNDHTHTSPAGANVVAQAFVRGLICGNSALASHVNSAGKVVPNGCM